MNIKQVICDNCDRDLSDGGSFEMYRLLLKSELAPSTSNTTVDIWVHPPLKEDKYFCGLGCLSLWLEKKAKQ